VKTEIPLLEGSYKYLGLLAVLLLFIVLRWNNFNAPLIRDEGEYACAGRLLMHGMAPYEHAFIQKPPMVIYSYALANLLLPHVFWAPRLLACGFVLLATALLGCIARLEWGGGLALPAMGLMTVMVLLPGADQFTANTEMFLLLPLLATLLVYLRDRHSHRRRRHWLVAGFLAATTLAYKYTALPLLLFIFAAWSVEQWRQTRDAGVLQRSWVAAVVGGLMAMALELGYFWVHDGGRHLWECTVSFNRLYVESNTFGWIRLGSQLGRFWNEWWILFLVPWAIFLSFKPRMWFWIGLFLCAWLATGASGYSQYYVVVMPFWALLCAMGINALALRINALPARPKAWPGALLTALVVLLLLWPDAPWIFSSREQFAEKKMGGFPFVGSLAVASRVAELSTADDRVFVAGSEPQILFYAHRRSPTRFLTVYPLMIPTSMAVAYQREAIQNLTMQPPKLVVFCTTPNSWLRQPATPPAFLDFLDSLLKQNYTLIGGYVPDGKAGHWSEPLSANEQADASLLLYRRRAP